MKTSHIICILKIVTGLCLLKQRIKTKSTFVNVTVFLQCFSSEKVLTKHRENRLIIKDKQNVKLGKGSISFKNYSKQLPAPFIICADFECILCPTLSKNSCDKNISHTEKYQDHILCSFAYKVVCGDNKFSKGVVLYRGKNAAYKFIEAILEECKYCRKVIKKHFNKNLIMSAEEEEKFRLSNSCWICDELFDAGDEKVRDHCHITGKYRCSSFQLQC